MIELRALNIVKGQESPELEGFAAAELGRYLRILFGHDVGILGKLPKENIPLVLLGNPETNPVIGELGLDKDWPQTTDQGFILKSLSVDDRTIWLVGGGSPAATLWAVYGLIEKLGVRYLLSGDVFPEPLGGITLPEVDEQREPVFVDRVWRMLNDEPHGPEMWSLDENRRVIDQLAKLRINTIYFQTYPYHPFVHYEFRGIKKTTATLNFGLKYPIDEDTIGREHFGDVDEFINPEFQNCRDYDDWFERGQNYAHTVFSYAKSRGIRVGMALNLVDVPQEFKDKFHEWSPDRDELSDEEAVTDYVRLGEVTMGAPPHGRGFADVDNPAKLELSEIIVDAYLETYPELDFIMLGTTEFRNTVTGYEKCWKHLDSKYGIESVVPLEEVVASASSRFFHSEGRAERELKGDIEFLYFVEKLFVEKGLVDRLGRDDLQIIISPVTEELHPILGKIFPSNFAINTSIDYSLSLSLERIEILDSFADTKIDHYYLLSLQDDIQSLFVSSEGARVEAFLETMRRYHFRGWITRYWSIGDLDHSALYLANASWDEDLKLRDAYDDYIISLCGEACLPEMREALGIFEENTHLQGTDLFGVGFPYPGLLQRHFDMGRHLEGSLEPHEDLLKCRERYIRARELVRLALAKARPEARGRLEYMIGRATTCALFMETAYIVEAAGLAYRAAAKAREERDVEVVTAKLNESATLLKKALALTRRTINAHIDILRDESDLGLLAAMNEYMYKYVKARSFLVGLEASNWHL